MPIWSGSSSLDTLQDAVEEVFLGAGLDMTGVKRLTVLIKGTFVATINFEGKIEEGGEGETWFPVGLKTAADGNAAVSATAAGVFKLPVDGPALYRFQARVEPYTSGAVTVLARREYS